MNYKLKHLAKYCCKPANELEFEAVKMAAEIGGVEWYSGNMFNGNEYTHLAYGSINQIGYYRKEGVKNKTEISVLDFCNKLRMTEEEARELEDDRVRLSVNENWKYSRGCKRIIALNGHYFKLNEDGTEVTLHKKGK